MVMKLVNDVVTIDMGEHDESRRDAKCHKNTNATKSMIE
jgi:hypothetical protein